MTTSGQPHKRIKKKENLFELAQFGIQLASMVIVGFVMGFFCDRWFPTSPYGTIFFFIMGIAAAIRQMVREIRKQMKEEQHGH